MLLIFQDDSQEVGQAGQAEEACCRAVNKRRHLAGA